MTQQQQIKQLERVVERLAKAVSRGWICPPQADCSPEQAKQSTRTLCDACWTRWAMKGGKE